MIQFDLKRRSKSFLVMKLYLGAIRALVHLTNNIWPDICFAVNLLARFSFSSIKGHSNGVEHMFEYPRRTIVMSLFYYEESKTKLIVYAEAEYSSNPLKVQSQTRFMFACGDTIISWRSIKQMLLYRNKSSPWSNSKVRLVEINNTPYSGNVWFFFEIKCTYHNVRRLETSSQEIKWCFNQGEYNTRCTLFPLTEVFSHWIFLARFLMRQQIVRIKRYVYYFSFTRIFSHRVFSSKVLTRHNIYGHPRGSVINALNERIVHKVSTWTTIHIQ